MQEWPDQHEPDSVIMPDTSGNTDPCKSPTSPSACNDGNNMNSGEAVCEVLLSVTASDSSATDHPQPMPAQTSSCTPAGEKPSGQHVDDIPLAFWLKQHFLKPVTRTLVELLKHLFVISSTCIFFRVSHIIVEVTVGNDILGKFPAAKVFYDDCIIVIAVIYLVSSEISLICPFLLSCGKDITIAIRRKLRERLKNW